jgi:large subunit ribosomal protein L10
VESQIFLIHKIMLTREEKSEVLKELDEKLAKAQGIFFLDFGKTKTSDVNGLKKALITISGEFKVAKKTLTQKALKSQGKKIAHFEPSGPMAIGLAYSDVVPVAKAFVDFGRKSQSLKVLSGWIGGQTYTSEQVIALSRLPSLKVLEAQLLMTFNGPTQNLVYVLNGNASKLVNALHAISEKSA